MHYCRIIKLFGLGIMACCMIIWTTLVFPQGGWWPITSKNDDSHKLRDRRHHSRILWYYWRDSASYLSGCDWTRIDEVTTSWKRLIWRWISLRSSNESRPDKSYKGRAIMISSYLSWFEVCTDALSAWKDEELTEMSALTSNKKSKRNEKKWNGVPTDFYLAVDYCAFCSTVF